MGFSEQRYQRKCNCGKGFSPLKTDWKCPYCKRSYLMVYKEEDLLDPPKKNEKPKGKWRDN